MKLCAEMLLRFHWQIEKNWQELGLGPGFCLISSLQLVLIRNNQTWKDKLNFSG